MANDSFCIGEKGCIVMNTINNLNNKYKLTNALNAGTSWAIWTPERDNWKLPHDASSYTLEPSYGPKAPLY